MTPSFTNAGQVSGHICNAELCGELHVWHSSCGAKLAHFLNGLLCQLGIYMIASNWSKVLRSGFSIFGVLKACSGVKVLWAHARRVVAMVTDKKPGRYRPDVNKMGKPVGANPLAVYGDASVSISIHATSPIPAGFRFGNFVPKVLEVSRIQLEKLTIVWDCFRRGNVFVHIVSSGLDALMAHPACAFYRLNRASKQG